MPYESHDGPALRYPEIDFGGASCASCHAQSIDFINTKHIAFSVNLTTPPATTATCLACHSNGGMDTNFAHSFFPVASADIHALGAPAVHVTGTIGCASCHTAATSGDYAHADCTVCHTQTAMAPPHVAVADLQFTTPKETSALCLRCHADSQVPIAVATTPANHVPPVANHAPFDVSSGALHYQKPCLTCHAVARTDKPFAQDFKQQACIGCHSETIDQVVSRHASLQIAVVPTDTSSCLGCHPNGEPATNFNHIFFPLAQADVHALGAPAVHLPGTIGCKSCHTTGDSRRVDCTVCHGPTDQGSKHSGLIGPEPGGGPPLWSGTGPAPGGETANCLLCHAIGGLQRVATHGQSPAEPAGFPIATGNHFQSCEQCHTARKTDPRLKNQELDFAAANCANCHAQALDSIVTKHAAFGVDLTTPPATTATCLGCHSDGGMARNFDHPFFPIASTDIHALGAPAVHVTGTISCASCHTPATNSDYAKVDCTVCHLSTSMQPLHVAVSDLPAAYPSPDSATFATSALCLRCHADAAVSRSRPRRRLTYRRSRRTPRSWWRATPRTTRSPVSPATLPRAPTRPGQPTSRSPSTASAATPTRPPRRTISHRTAGTPGPTATATRPASAAIRRATSDRSITPRTSRSLPATCTAARSRPAPAATRTGTPRPT